MTPASAPRSSSLPQPTDPRFGYIIAFLTVAGFAVSLNIRITDPLLPTLANEFATTPGKVAIVSVFYAIAHGFMQLAGGPVGDRYGKLRVVILAAFAAAGATAATSLAGSVAELSAFRLLSGATAAIVFPLAFAWVGDVVPYEQRQVIMARLFGGAMFGAMTGQAVSGIFADFIGWRGVFLVGGSLFLLAATGLTLAHGVRKDPTARTAGGPGLLADILTPFLLLRKPQPRVVLGTSAAEGFFVMSTTTFLGAYMHDRFGLTFTQIGLVLALFGAGGLFYTIVASWLIARLGERRLVSYGGTIFTLSFLGVAVTPFWQAIPLFLFSCGASLLMVHNTLQLRATQMAPETRGSAMSAFAASFFAGQLGGIAIAGFLYDRFGGSVLIAYGALGFAVVALVYWLRLAKLDKKS